jgi:cardiolipin synthase
VRYIHSGFLANWREACPDQKHVTPDYPDANAPGAAAIQVVRSASAIYWCDTAVLFRTVLEEAAHSICIATAYFVPDNRLTELLCNAVERGVDVKVLLPWKQTDQVLAQLSGGDHFRRLLDAGVKLFRFKPTMLHAKILTVDHKYAVIGSANINQRSMAKDEELCLVVDDEHTVSTLERHYEQDLARSARFELNSWEERSVLRRMAEVALRVLRKEL